MENKQVIIYSTPTCIYCQLLKDWLKQNNISFLDYDLSNDAEKREEAVKKSGQMGVPIVDIEGEIIVGFDKKRISELLGI